LTFTQPLQERTGACLSTRFEMMPSSPHGAGVAEHGLTVLRIEVLAVDQRRRRLPELRPE
jgi:hypothetical protein